MEELCVQRLELFMGCWSAETANGQTRRQTDRQTYAMKITATFIFVEILVFLL